ncbi:MAG TPA: ABC transporter permease [Rhodanobacteraceae bacterium]
MQYFQLIWAALFRRKTRTFLTLVSILAAFLLFGLLSGVRTAFDSAGASMAGARILMTSSRVSLMDTLPQSLGQQIAKVKGVDKVVYVNWFGGIYQDAHNQIITYAVGPGYLSMFPKETISTKAGKAFANTRVGLLVGQKLAAKYHWKVGQQIPLMSSIYPRNDGSKTWPVVIVGIMHPAKGTGGNARLESAALMHWEYFDKSNPYNRGTVGWYVSRVDNVSQSAQIGKVIDAISANSDHETRTRSMQAFIASQVKQFADVGMIAGSIMGAVFFTLLLLTGNTMAQAVRERTSELAVLKVLGFSNRSVLGIVLAESVLLVLIGGVIGMGLVTVISPGVTAASSGSVNLPTVGWTIWWQAIGLMVAVGLLVGALPAIRAMRLNMVDALAGR